MGMDLVEHAIQQGGTGRIECPVLAVIAAGAGCSRNTLYMIARRAKVPSPHLSVRIERASGRSVSRRDLRPHDWWQLWPELVTPEHPIPNAEAAGCRRVA